jgi:GT2 family glycosyltransferase
MLNRSFIIPVLSLGEGAPYNILTLLEDLRGIEGEVICIFNSREVFERLQDHSRIDKYCFNKTNAGVSRSWNMGLHLSESATVFILNEDLHIQVAAVDQMEQYLYQLPDAVLVAPQGSYLDFTSLRIIRYFEKGSFSRPVRTHDVSGFFFAIHMERFIRHKLCFDNRFSPCFMEEWDMGMQVMKAGLACYAVPVKAFDHQWGISGGLDNTPIPYFGRLVYRNAVLTSNRRKFLNKWFATQAADDGSGLNNGK